MLELIMETGTGFRIRVSYLLPLFWHPLLRFSFNNKVHRCVDVRMYADLQC